MEKWNKLLDYVTEQKDRCYDLADKALKEDNMLVNQICIAQATAFQRVRYFMETLDEFII